MTDSEKLKIALDALQTISDRIDWVPGPCEDDFDGDMFDWHSGNADDDISFGERIGEYYAAVTAREALDKIKI